MWQRQLGRELARFGVAGSTASAINWLVRLVVSLLVPFPVALVIDAVAGLIVGFVLYRTWVFPGSTLRLPLQSFRFLIVNAVSACVVIGMALLIAPLLVGLPISTLNQQNLAHAIAIGLGAVINFVGHRWFTFGRRTGRLMPVTDRGRREPRQQRVTDAHTTLTRES